MEFINVFDYIGIVAFAMTGVLKGIKHRLDIFGFLVLAVFTALGGGLIRDTLLGVKPPMAFQNHYYWWIIVGTVILTMLLRRSKLLNDDSLTLNTADAVGLAAFTFIGCKVAYEIGVGGPGVIFCGVLTAVGGGVIRDLLVSEIPLILRVSLYAPASLLGAVCFYAAHLLGMPPLLNAVITFAAVFVLRMLSILKKWNLPKYE